MILLSGNSNKPLSNSVGKALNTPIADIEKILFPDGEIVLNFQDPVQWKNIFVIQPTSPPVTENLMELLLILDTLRQNSAKKITVLLPYFGYGRQDQKNTSGSTPLQTVARLIETAGASEIIVVDCHWEKSHHFFNIPVTHLHTTSLIANYSHRNIDLTNILLVAPDQGSVERTKRLADILNLEMITLEKQRNKDGIPHMKQAPNHVLGKNCLIIDDIIDSGQTLCCAVNALKEQGAQDIYAFITHGVFSKGAPQRLEKSPLKELIITDSIEATPETLACKKIKHLSIAPLLADAISRLRDPVTLRIASSL